MICPSCDRPMLTSVYRADDGQRWTLYVCDVDELELAEELVDEPESCPLCGGELEEHTVCEDERLYSIFYCGACFAEWLSCGFDEWVAVDPPTTRPVATIPAAPDSVPEA